MVPVLTRYFNPRHTLIGHCIHIFKLVDTRSVETSFCGDFEMQMRYSLTHSGVDTVLNWSARTKAPELARRHVGIAYYFTAFNCSRSLLSRFGKIDWAPLRRWKLKSIPEPNTNFQQRKGRESGPCHLPTWRWSETERRGSIQRHLLLPLGIQGPVHLHTPVHRSCYFNALASRFEFEYCEYYTISQHLIAHAHCY